MYDVRIFSFSMDIQMWAHWVLGMATLLVILLSVIVGCLVMSLQNKYAECTESNVVTGRAQYLEHLKQKKAVIGQGSKTITTVAGSPDEEVIKYHGVRSVRDILNVHDRAKSENIDEALAKIYAQGNNFLICEKCHPVTPDNLPSTWKSDMKEIEKLRTIGLQDFYHGNIMVCGNGSEARLKMTDQDPSLELEALGYSVHTREQFKQTMYRFSLFESERERRELERRVGDNSAQEE